VLGLVLVAAAGAMRRRRGLGGGRTMCVSKVIDVKSAIPEQHL
jgi:hypothetical protein